MNGVVRALRRGLHPWRRDLAGRAHRAPDVEVGPLLFTPGRFWLLVAVTVGIFVMRRPWAFFDPMFYAEDGSHFFTGAYEYGFWDGLLRPVGGYLRITQRALAECFSLFPLAWQPTVYAWGCQLITSVCLCLIYTPWFRPLIRSDAARALLAVFLTLLWHHERPGTLDGIDWFLMYAFSLTVLAPMPHSKGGQGVWWLVALASLTTKAVAAAVAPVLIVRLLVTPRSVDRIWCGGVLVVALLMLLAAESGDNQTEGATLLGLVAGMLNGFSFRIVDTLVLGWEYANQLLKTWGYGAVHVVAIGVGAIAGVMVMRLRDKRLNVYLLVGMAIVLLMYLPFFVRFDFVLDYTEVEVPALWWHPRYFATSVLVLATLLYMLGERWMVQRRALSLGLRYVVIVFAVLMALVQLPAFVQRVHTPTQDWTTVQGEIRLAELRAAESGQTQYLEFKTMPGNWMIYLRVEPRRRSHD